MPSKWIEFVKEWSRENNMSYGCALSKPEMKAAYYKKHPKKLTKKQIKEKEQMELVGMMKQDMLSNKLNKERKQQETENIKMSLEDINLSKKKKAKQKKAKPPVELVIEEEKPKKPKLARRKTKELIEEKIPTLEELLAELPDLEPLDYEKKGKGIFKPIGKATKQFVERSAKKVGNVTKEVVEDVKEYGKAVIYGRMDYPPKVREILKNNGEEVVVGYKIKRTPVNKLLKSALSAVSLGEFGRRFNRSEYDDLFHLFLEMTTSSGKRISVEKNEVINMDLSPPTRDKEEVKEISNAPKDLTINTIMTNTENYMGKKKFFGYSARDNNCQDFIVALLKSNNIGNEQDIAFVKQNTKELFDKLPFLRKFSNTITTIGARVNVLTTGAGMNSDYIVQSIVFNKDKWTTPKAKKWLKENNYVSPKVDKKENTLRFRQKDPLEAEKEGFTEYRTKDLGDSGIQLILSYKKKISGNGIKRMPRFEKGSQEAKDYMASIRAKSMKGGAVMKPAVMPMEDHCPMCKSKMKGGKVKVNLKGTILDRRFKTPAELREDFGINAAEKVANKISKGTKQSAKAVGNYVTSTDRGGLSDDLLKYGLPAVTGSLFGGLAGAATLGNPAAIIPATAIGTKLGAVAGNQTSKKVIGQGVRKGRFVKGSPEAIAWGEKMRALRKK